MNYFLYLPGNDEVIFLQSIKGVQVRRHRRNGEVSHVIIIYNIGGQCSIYSVQDMKYLCNYFNIPMEMIDEEEDV